MSYFISTNTIKKAYQELIKTEIKNPNIWFSFLILKGCKYNNLTYTPIENISKFGVDTTYRLSGLFNPNENPSPKFNFINPYRMDNWSSNPTEPMDKWVNNRLKNNIIGGATTWRPVINANLNSDELKFTYNYIQEIQKLTNTKNVKVNLLAIAIWFNRFTEFEQKLTIGDLIKDFKNSLNISEKELSSFFKINNNIQIDYQSTMHNTSEIRTVIGKPNIQEDWINVENISTNDEVNLPFRRINMNEVVNNRAINEETILELLNRYYQVILSGPPGTSKSFISRIIGNSFDTVTNIQFHPQYSYQQFIGGYLVEGKDVFYNEGVLLKLLNKIKLEKDKDKKHLLIIDEINRANLSQVLGEVIQCLDRNYDSQILIDGQIETISLPKNLYIIGTMNSSDRTIGSIDHALRRRFTNVYCPPNPDILINLCPDYEELNVTDLLIIINSNLLNTLKNREFLIGHAFFLDESVLNPDGMYYWDINSLELLFNYKILPLIEEFCYGNVSQINSVIGEDLASRLTNNEFEDAIKEYTYK